MRDHGQHRGVDRPRSMHAAWNALAGSDCPFLRHEFLAALEHTGCVGAGTGWSPRHLHAARAPAARGARRPLYLKSHSWGEFVFDFALGAGLRAARARTTTRSSWSRCPSRRRRAAAAGAPGRRRAPRVARRADRPGIAGRDARRRLLLGARAVHRRAGPRGCSSGRAGCCGATASSTGTTTATRTSRRTSPPSPRRSARRRSASGAASRRPASLRTLLRRGDRRARCWTRCTPCTPQTFQRHGHEPYLTREFFARDRAHAWASAAWSSSPGTAASPSPRRSSSGRTDALYGRYWGAGGDYHSLHFETCYYQGIEYCIEHGHRSASSPARRASTRSAAASSRRSPGRRTTSRIARVPRRRSATSWRARHAAVDAYAAEVARSTSRSGRRDEDADHLARRPTDPPERFPPVEQALRRAAGAAGRRRGSLARAAAGRLPARHLSLVLAPASRCCGGRRTRAKCCFRSEFHRSPQPCARRCATAASSGTGTGTSRHVIARLRRAARRRSPGPGSRAEMQRRLRAAARARHRPQRRDLARRGGWSAACTASQLGGVFFGESMFSRRSDASKVALARAGRALRGRRASS